jgi:hypothetical protein
VRSLDLKSDAAWKAYCCSGRKPADIPANPRVIYLTEGWAGLGDWLGTGRVANQSKIFRSFEKARAFARSRGFRSSTEWRDYCRSGKKPADIPSNPNYEYAKSGWIGYSDWLGTGKVPPGQFRPFQKARAFVRSLGLKSGSEWKTYCKSGRKPADIPNAPQAVYANDGWAGTGDWLGTDHA